MKTNRDLKRNIYIYILLNKGERIVNVGERKKSMTQCQSAALRENGQTLTIFFF